MRSVVALGVIAGAVVAVLASRPGTGDSAHAVSTFPDFVSLAVFFACAVASMVWAGKRAVPLFRASLLFGIAAGIVLGLSTTARALLTLSSPRVDVLSAAVVISLVSSVLIAAVSAGLVRITGRITAAGA